MEKLIEIMNQLNAQTLFGVTIIVWYFSRDIKMEIRRLEDRIDSQVSRTDKMHEMYCQMNKEFHDKWADSNKKWIESNQKWMELKIETNELRKEAKK